MRLQRLLAFVVLLLWVVSPAFARGLSRNARNAFTNWQICAPPPVTGYVGPGSHRFVPVNGVITWRVQPIGDMEPHITQAMSIVASKMAGVVSFQKVPYTDTTAMKTFRQGSSMVVPGYRMYQVEGGCGTFATYAADRMTMLSSETVCLDPYGVSLALAMHEVWWHDFLSPLCHTTSGCGDPNGDNGAPSWECVAGHTELARWIYTVPIGSKP